MSTKRLIALFGAMVLVIVLVLAIIVIIEPDEKKPAGGTPVDSALAFVYDGYYRLGDFVSYYQNFTEDGEEKCLISQYRIVGLDENNVTVNYSAYYQDRPDILFTTWEVEVAKKTFLAFDLAFAWKSDRAPQIYFLDEQLIDTPMGQRLCQHFYTIWEENETGLFAYSGWIEFWICNKTSIRTISDSGFKTEIKDANIEEVTGQFDEGVYWVPRVGDYVEWKYGYDDNRTLPEPFMRSTRWTVLSVSDEAIIIQSSERKPYMLTPDQMANNSNPLIFIENITIYRDGVNIFINLTALNLTVFDDLEGESGTSYIQLGEGVINTTWGPRTCYQYCLISFDSQGTFRNDEVWVRGGILVMNQMFGIVDTNIPQIIYE